ncbi:hypothetical protein A3L09_07510 [Thermococcus profundus]|uniref:Uncharacterized protein n=1 Tax=Thermococcus profundus TaxID=49899 RepID=A0A2Z2ML07_THEPR|nr:hypothetical protein [Thermococcus profundus]ASJ03111.1 hypothetical protein A3L09_07510 [Thermococcus profundus]
MRLVTKSPSIKEALTGELRKEGIKFELTERSSYETFVGYTIEGTLDEIRAKIETMESAEREAIMEGFTSFKESIMHVLDHLKAGAQAEKLLAEGPWVVDILDQLYTSGVVDYNPEDGSLKLKEGVDTAAIPFQFKFPFDLVTNPEGVEKIAKQFVFTDLVQEWEFEIHELDIGKINALGRIASRYFPEDYVLKVYFALIGRAILAGEILKALGSGKADLNELRKAFLSSMPIQIPTEKGTLVINSSKEAFDAVIRFLEKQGYVDVKAGKVRKLRDIA